MSFSSIMQVLTASLITRNWIKTTKTWCFYKSYAGLQKYVHQLATGDLMETTVLDETFWDLADLMKTEQFLRWHVCSNIHQHTCHNVTTFTSVL
jgi:hypothetical protein